MLERPEDQGVYYFEDKWGGNGLCYYDGTYFYDLRPEKIQEILGHKFLELGQMVYPTKVWEISRNDNEES